MKILIPVAIAITGFMLFGCSEKSVSNVGERPPTNVTTAPSSQGYAKLLTSRPAVFPPTLVSADGACSLEVFNDKISNAVNLVNNKSQVKLTGWAGNVIGGAIPREVWLEFVGISSAYVQASTGLARPDVASAFNKQSLTNSGWTVFVDLSSLAVGSYKVRVLMHEAAGELSCETNSTFQID